VISSNEKKKKPDTKTSKGTPTTNSSADKVKGKHPKQAPSAKPDPPSDGDSDNLSSDQEPDKAGVGSAGCIAAARRSGTLVPSKSLETTLFDRMERMWGDGVKQMLNIQYRYVCDIASTVSSTHGMTLT
jgi:DNA polymerase alpha-associated DNA helicase A